MASDCVERRLAAILAADMVGYSRLMEADERGTIGRRRSSSRQSRGASCFAGRLVSLFAALLLAACGGTFAKTLPAGPATPISSDSVVVFGKVEVRIDDRALGYEHGRLDLESSSKVFQFVYIPVEPNEDFYAVIPKDAYLFLRFKYNNRDIKCLGKMGFDVPQDAAAVFVGTLVFEGRTESWIDKWFAIPTEMTLSVKDDYDQSVRRLRERNPDLSGSIVKGLFRFEGRFGITGHSPEPDATMLCLKREPGTLILPFVLSQGWWRIGKLA